jgi:uncharacterized membrane protein YcaP (DUF421 family)
MTPFEFVLILFIGGLALTATVGEEVSSTNAICQIISIGLAHYSLAWARSKSSRFARLVDGTPLILLENKEWRVGERAVLAHDQSFHNGLAFVLAALSCPHQP